jgi:hypothetical protein
VAGPSASLSAVGRPPVTEVDQHDHEQLDLQFHHALGDDAGRHTYRVDAYLFVPRSVGVNRTNYAKPEFYADVTPLMRLEAEPLPLEQLADPRAPRSPLHRLAAATLALRAAAPEPTRPLVVQVKLYAYLFVEGVRAELRALRLALRRGPAGLAALDGALARMRGALWAYRRARAELWPFEPVCHQGFVEAMRAADEYMSLFLDERLARFVERIEGDEALRDGSGLCAKVHVAVAALAAEEARHRLTYGHLRLSSTRPREAEYFAYHMSLLKKTVHNALYLEARSIESDDVFLRNAIAATGAALAAIWALATQLPTTLAGLPATTKLLVFGGAVLAYVLKDRIKAVTNDVLSTRLRKFDHKSWLHGPTMALLGLGGLRIRAREVMRFLTPGEVPPTITALRLARRTVRRAERLTEEVIHYRKEITAIVDDEHVVPEGYSLRDILRLNVRHFLVRLDDPIDRHRFFDPQAGTFATAQLPKVYHLNLVLAVGRAEEGGDADEPPALEHLRVVLDKQGIVRVERVGD